MLLVRIKLPTEIPELWEQTLDNAKLSGKIHRVFQLGYEYSGGMYLSYPAKIYARNLTKEGNRIINGGVCLAQTFYQSLEPYLTNSISARKNESADWMAFESGIAVNSDAFSTGLILYSDINHFSVVKKGVRLPFSSKLTDGIVTISTNQNPYINFQIACNAMGNNSLRKILRFVQVKEK